MFPLVRQNPRRMGIWGSEGRLTSHTLARVLVTPLTPKRPDAHAPALPAAAVVGLRS